MSVGDYLWVDQANRVLRQLIRVIGVPEVHSHFRVRPLAKWFRQNRNRVSGAVIAEIGCGQGLNIFELLKIVPDAAVVRGFDLNQTAVDTAERVKRLHGVSETVQFHCRDCSTFAFESKLDVVLLIDFLEHIEDPGKLLLDLNAIVKKDATLLISVPTYTYPKVFGRTFHKRVGHLRDGFTERELSSLLSAAGFCVNQVEYNTGPIAAVACYAFYNVLVAPTLFRLFSGFALSLFRWFDFFNGPRLSCSMFLVASRVSNASEVQQPNGIDRR